VVVQLHAKKTFAQRKIFLEGTLGTAGVL